MFLVPMSRHAHAFPRSLDPLFDDSFLDRFLAPTASGDDGGSRSPALDVRETAQGYTVQVDLPGVAKEDVKIHIEGRRVSLSAETRSALEKTDGERVLHRERSVSSYARSFTLPVEIDQTSSAARLADGVLTLTLAKRSAASAAQLSVQ